MQTSKHLITSNRIKHDGPLRYRRYAPHAPHQTANRTSHTKQHHRTPLLRFLPALPPPRPSATRCCSTSSSLSSSESPSSYFTWYHLHTQPRQSLTHKHTHHAEQHLASLNPTQYHTITHSNSHSLVSHTPATNIKSPHNTLPAATVVSVHSPLKVASAPATSAHQKVPTHSRTNKPSPSLHPSIPTVPSASSQTRR